MQFLLILYIVSNCTVITWKEGKWEVKMSFTLYGEDRVHRWRPMSFYKFSFVKVLSNSQIQFASLCGVARPRKGCWKTNGGGFSFSLSFFHLSWSFFDWNFSFLPTHFIAFFESIEFSHCGFLLWCVGLICYAKFKLLKDTKVCSVDMDNWLVWFSFCCWVLDGLVHILYLLLKNIIWFLGVVELPRNLFLFLYLFYHFGGDMNFDSRFSIWLCELCSSIGDLGLGHGSLLESAASGWIYGRICLGLVPLCI